MAPMTPRDASQRPRCIMNPMERQFRALIARVFATDGLLLNGSIIDAGANDGGEACFLADLAPDRIVHALEPLAYHFRNVLNVSSSRPNVRPMLGALGSVERIVSVRQTPHNGHHTQLTMIQRAPASNSSDADDLFGVYRIDSLFTREWAGQRFALGHFDLEGGELDMLQGSEETIRRDRPLLTLEVGVKTKVGPALDALRALGYRGYIVPERCGFTSTCRNMLCFPTERLPPPAIVNRSLLLPLPPE
jgi:FkbM family methyltransferase